jgi:hypothetical protein
MATVSAYVEHQLPNRTRLRVPERRGDAKFFTDLAKQIAALPTVRHVGVNARTTSVLIEHHGHLQALADEAARRGIFQLSGQPANPRRTHTMHRGSTVSPVEPLTWVAAGLTGLGMLQTGRGRFGGNALESFWQGYSAQVLLHQPWLAVALVSIGLYHVVNGRLLGPATSLFFHAASARHLARTLQAKQQPAGPTQSPPGQYPTG